MVVVSVIISKQLTPKEKPVYCMNCKTHLFTVSGDFLMIWQGEGYPLREIPLNMPWVQHVCRGCKKKYNFYFQV